MARRYANLYPGRPGGPWIAFLKIPADVQHIVKGTNGKPWFQVSTGERNQAKAHAVAAPMLAEWRRRIDEARKTNQDPLQVELQRLKKIYGQAVESGDGGDLFGAILQFFHDRGALVPGEILTDKDGRLQVSHETIMEPKTSTNFLTHIEQWKQAGRYKPDQLRTACSHINMFAGSVNQPIEKLTSAHVQVWVDGQSGDALNTIKNRLYSVKNYWTWMSRRGLAPDTKPFDGIEIRSQVDNDEPVRFDPVDVPKLWEKALTIHAPLYHLVMIGAYSGARREAICQLTKDDVWLNAPIPMLLIRQDKTDAGRREVPIHSEIINLMKELVKNADSDGFLIHSTAKGERRADPLGKRFTRMKQEMGFDETRNFHSIRRTVIHLFEAAEAPEGVAKDIVGHKKRSLTYGTYSGTTTLKQKQEWLERAIRYPN